MAFQAGPNDVIVLDVQDEIAELRFSDPDRRNCVSVEFAEDLLKLTRHIDQRLGDVYAITITHEGPVLSAGYDLDVVGDPDAGDQRSYLMDRYRAARAWLSNVDRPVVTGAKGPAVAAGAAFIGLADINVVSEAFQMWYPEINVGVFPLTMGPSFIKTYGPHRAAELTFLGAEAKLSAEEARELGLINRIVDAEDVDATVRDMAQTIAGYERAYGYMLDAYEVFNLARREYDQLEGSGRAVGNWRSTYDQWYGDGLLIDQETGMPAGRGGDPREDAPADP